MSLSDNTDQAAIDRPSVDGPFYEPITLENCWSGSISMFIPAWVVGVILIVPIGILSTMPSAPVVAGGIAFDFFLFLPLVICVPITLWAGYPWAAVPVWLASFAMAASSNVPLEWAALYACVAPVSLGVYSLAYRSVPMRTDLRTVPSILFFVIASFVAAVIHSSGVFLFNANAIGDTGALFSRWQSWWTGSLASVVVGAGPILFFGSRTIAAVKRRSGLGSRVRRDLASPALYIAFWVCIASIFAFLFAIHSFVEANIARTLASVASASHLRNIEAALQGHHLLHVTMGFMLVISCLFWYQVVVRWTAEARATAARLDRDNRRLKSEATLRRRHESELRRQANNLKASNAAKDRLFGLIAHDLRGPVGSIVSVASFLSEHYDEQDDKTSRELLEVISASSDRAYSLLDNLLDWARLQLGAAPMKPETFDMNALAGAVLGLQGRNAEQRGVTLRLDTERALVANADINVVRSVLMNLVSNAVKFSKDGDTVVVEIIQSDNQLEVAVRDTGVGMTNEEVSNLFRIDQLRTSRDGDGETGAGLGLIICKELLDECGSRLVVDSSPGVGSTFTFFIPADKAEASIRPAAEREPISRDASWLARQRRGSTKG